MMDGWQRLHLGVGILERSGTLLLVANQYPNQPALLWNLPGGRADRLEGIDQTVVREFREETGLEVRVERLAYVAESFDRRARVHVTAFAFRVRAERFEFAVPHADAHVRGCEWVERDALAARLTVPVIREPLLRYLADPSAQFSSYHDAGITIAFAD